MNKLQHYPNNTVRVPKGYDADFKQEADCTWKSHHLE